VPDAPLPRSALAARYKEGLFGAVGSAGPEVTLCESRGHAMFLLDGPAEDPSFLNAVQEALGCAPPKDSGRTSTKGSRRAFWVAPGRWMIVAPRSDLESLKATLSVALIGRAGALTELSQARTVIRVTGPKKLDLLSKGCSLDLHPRVFEPGSCAQSLVAGISTTINLDEEGDAIDLFVMRSFGVSLWDWLLEAGAEYGVGVAPVLSST